MCLLLVKVAVLFLKYMTTEACELDILFVVRALLWEDTQQILGDKKCQRTLRTDLSGFYSIHPQYLFKDFSFFHVQEHYFCILRGSDFLSTLSLFQFFYKGHSCSVLLCIRKGVTVRCRNDC